MPRLAQHPGVDAYASSLGEPRFSASLERGLAILACFTTERPVLGIADVADELGMARSTTHRYMSTLVELGYLAQGPGSKYRLTLAVTHLGMGALNATGLREHARPHIEDLRRESTYTTAIAVLDGPWILYIDRLPSLRRGRDPLDLAPGSRLPTYCTAMGKVLLASLPEYAQRTLIVEMKLKRRTPNTITSKTLLRAELKLMAEEGIAINDQEDTTSTHAIAAAVREDSGEVTAAISIAASPAIISLEDLVEHLTPHLLATADRISARLGHRHADKRGGHS